MASSDSTSFFAASSADLVEKNYVFPTDAELFADSIRSVSAQLDAAWPDIESLNKVLAEIVPDKHLRFRQTTPSPRSSLDKGSAPPHSFQSVQRWVDGTVCFKLAPYITGDPLAVKAAFTLASNAPVLVLDVRECKGGNPDIVACILGSLLGSAPLHVGDFRRREGRNFPIVTRPGFGEFSGDVAVLTSSQSFSAAESLAYILQAHDGARVIGAVTAGGANPVSHFKMTEEVTLAIPTGSPVIFATEGNWEGRGVQPDRIVDPALSAQEMLQACI